MNYGIKVNLKQFRVLESLVPSSVMQTRNQELEINALRLFLMGLQPLDLCRQNFELPFLNIETPRSISSRNFPDYILNLPMTSNSWPAMEPYRRAGTPCGSGDIGDTRTCSRASGIPAEASPFMCAMSIRSGSGWCMSRREAQVHIVFDSSTLSLYPAESPYDLG